MDPSEVAEHECIARLRPVGRSIGQAQVPDGVLVPGVGPEEAVLVISLGLDLAPVAVQDVLPRVDELSRVSDGPSVQCVTRLWAPRIARGVAHDLVYPPRSVTAGTR